MHAARCSLAISLALAVAACSSSSKPTGPTGFVQVVEGHQAIVITRGSTTMIVPFDRPPAGTVIVERGRVSRLGGRPVPESLLGCPCCVKGCPICVPGGGGVGCHPDVMPADLDWSGALGDELPSRLPPCARPPCPAAPQ